MDKINRTVGFIFNHPLAKKHMLLAFYRFLWWQIQSRLQPSKFIVKPFLHGINFYARKGLTGITGNIYTGLHEFNDMAFLLHYLRPSDVFIEVGANVGSYTLLASGVCKAKTICIEASSITAKATQANISLNQLQDSVTLIIAAAGAEPGLLAFSKNEDTTNHIISADETTNRDLEMVNVISIDSLTKKDKPVLIKIDVEGFETEVLQGLSLTLKQETLKAIIIELNGSGKRYGYNEEGIHALFISHNFKAYQYEPFSRNLYLMPSFGNYNTIYCRDPEFIIERLKSAKPFKIMTETI